LLPSHLHFIVCAIFFLSDTTSLPVFKFLILYFPLFTSSSPNHQHKGNLFAIRGFDLLGDFSFRKINSYVQTLPAQIGGQLVCPGSYILPNDKCIIAPAVCSPQQLVRFQKIPGGSHHPSQTTPLTFSHAKRCQLKIVIPAAPNKARDLPDGIVHFKHRAGIIIKPRTKRDQKLYFYAKFF